MRKLLAAMFAALLMVGCGEEAQKKAVQNEAKDDPSVPLLIPCEACDKEVSKSGEACFNCSHPIADSVDAYVELVQAIEEERKRLAELARIRAEEERKRQEEERKRLAELARIRAEEERKRQEEERKAKPYGGLEVLAKIKEAKESGDTVLNLYDNQITDISPLAGLTKLEELQLYKNQITDISPLKGLTNLEKLGLYDNKISDLSPLAGLTNLERLVLRGNPIPDDQKAMLKKALPNCKISF